MSSHITLNELFDISVFKHAELFKNCEMIWDPLNKLSVYLDTYDFTPFKGTVSKKAYFENKELIFIDEGTVVEPGAFIRGLCVIGKNCQIRHGAYLRGGVVLGDNCVVGHSTEVKNSIFLDGASAGHFAYVGDSILGNRVNLGAGAKCANLLFNKKNIEIRFETYSLKTHRRKLGAFLADDSQLGCNSVTSPGAILKKGAKVHPCTHISGVILEAHTVVWPYKPISVPGENYAFS